MAVCLKRCAEGVPHLVVAVLGRPDMALLLGQGPWRRMILHHSWAAMFTQTDSSLCGPQREGNPMSMHRIWTRSS